MASERLDIGIGSESPQRQLPPERIEFSSLAPLVRELEQAAVAEAGIDSNPAPVIRGSRTQPAPVFALSQVVRPARGPQSGQIDAVYQFTVGRDVADAVSRITAGLAGLPSSELVPAAAKHVSDGLLNAIRRGWAVQLVNGTTTPVFSTRNPPPTLAQQPTRSFASEIAARVIRVGGKNTKRPNARVQLLGTAGEATVVLPGVSAARALGNHLYGEVVLAGYGEWVVDPKRFMAPSRLLKFKVSDYRLLDPRGGNPPECLADVLGGVWDHIDPANHEQMLEAFGRGE